MNTGNRFFLKLSGFVLLLLLIVGAAYLVIASAINEDYVAEVNQQLYGGIAAHTVAEVTPLVDGEVDTTQIQDIMHSMMVINPSVEVYLLRPDGEIITYVAPYERVQLERVDLAPIRAFVAAASRDERPFLKGDDPRHPERRNIFSAAELHDAAGGLEGYVYIILSGEEQQAVAAHLHRSYVARMGGSWFLLSLLVACAVGLVGLRYLTRNLRRMTRAIERFKEGDYGVRIATEGLSEFKPMAGTFNRMADRIVRDMDEIKSVDRLRRELIANISHDLRTPLSIVQGFVETLLLKPDMPSEHRHKHLLTLHQATDRLGRMVADLFEYSKFEARQIEPHQEAFNIAELSRDVAHKFGVLAQKKNIDIRVDVPRDLPLVFADISLVERALNNLMDNALKFTPGGGSIDIAMRATDRAVEITVADSGPGISEEELPYVFDRYRRAGRREQPGMGIGLAIVKKIVELHDQTITIRSRLREGTTFAFRMPLA